jgi:hypothetical protein
MRAPHVLHAGPPASVTSTAPAQNGAGGSPPPIFVGGTGRSGTTILARLLGKHPDYTVIPTEAKFHCTPTGLPSVLRGRQSPELFAERMRGEWFSTPAGGEQLAAFLTRATLEGALERFLARAGEDPVAAGRGLIAELFGDYARSQGVDGWVEMTPLNAMWGAPYLIRLFPELRFVNVVRDGRDVAASLVLHGLLPDARAALAWWEDRLTRAHRQLAALPAGALLHIRFERLLVEDREGALQELLDFMGWQEEEAMWRFFNRRMPVTEAHVGRWMTVFSGRERELVAADYDAALHRLGAAGVALPAATGEPR